MSSREEELDEEIELFLAASNKESSESELDALPAFLAGSSSSGSGGAIKSSRAASSSGLESFFDESELDLELGLDFLLRELANLGDLALDFVLFLDFLELSLEKMSEKWSEESSFPEETFGVEGFDELLANLTADKILDLFEADDVGRLNAKILGVLLNLFEDL